MNGGLFDTFPEASKSNWKEAASKEIKGQNPFDALAFKSGNITQEPYYDSSDTDGLPEISLPTSADPFLGPRGWHNMPLVDVENLKNANETALWHLQSGADGILFHLKRPVDFQSLLQKIELPYCCVFFLVDGDHSGILIDFEQYVIRKGHDPSAITGGFIWTTFPTHLPSSINKFIGWKKFFAAGIQIPKQENLQDEIANGLYQGHRLVWQFIEHKIDTVHAFSQIAMATEAGTSFFPEIAKLKTLRRLWTQIEGAYKVLASGKPLFIHSTTKFSDQGQYAPNESMIKSPITALSAVLGGSNGITIIPDEPNEFKNRIARNVSNILKEESMIHYTADATTGSYYLETLIDQLSQKAWTIFQKKVEV